MYRVWCDQAHAGTAGKEITVCAAAWKIGDMRGGWLTRCTLPTPRETVKESETRIAGLATGQRRTTTLMKPVNAQSGN